MDRLKSEVSHLDELVNRLKGQHITPSNQGGQEAGSFRHPVNHPATYANDNYEHMPEYGHERDQAHAAAPKDEAAILAARKAAEEAEIRRKIIEYESSPATQSDMLRLIRTLDSLVWMRRSSSAAESSDTLEEEAKNKQPSNKYGRGNRSDDLIFTKGNLDHLTRRIKAWENVVRHKEEEGRYSFVP